MRLRIQQVRLSPSGEAVILRVEGDAVKVEVADGIEIWDKETVEQWPLLRPAPWERKKDEKVSGNG